MNLLKNYRLFLIVFGFAMAVVIFKPSDSFAYGGVYMPGGGWATLTDEGTGPANEVRWEFYRVSSVGVVGQTGNMGYIEIKHKKSGSSDVTYLCPATCPNSVVLTMPGGGTWTSDSYAYFNGSFQRVVNAMNGPINFSTGNRKVIRVFQPTFAASNKSVDNLAPLTKNRWYYNADATDFFRTEIRPTQQLNSGSSIPGLTYPQAPITGFTFNHYSTSASPAYTPHVIGPHTAQITENYAGNQDGWFNFSGYVVYSNGSVLTRSAEFTDAIIGIDRQLPTVSCQLYREDKGDGVDHPLNGNTGEYATVGGDRVLRAKVNVADQAGLSGTLDWVMETRLNGGAWTVNGTASAGDATNAWKTVTLPVTLPDDENNIFEVRLKARDNAWGATGLQDHYAYHNCGTDTTPISIHDTDYEMIEYKLYTDAARTQEVTAGIGLTPGTQLWGKITVRDNSMGTLMHNNVKIGRYNDWSGVPPAVNNPPSIPITPAPDEIVNFNPSTISFDIYTTYYNQLYSGFPNVKFFNVGPFNIPSSPIGIHTSYAFVDYLGQATEDNEANNLRSVQYFVGENQWFNTVGGDIGAVGTVSVSQNPVNGPQSKYMLVQGTGTNNSTTSESGWKLNGYTARLVPQAGGASASSLWNYFLPKTADSISGLIHGTGPGGEVIGNAPGTCFDRDDMWVNGLSNGPGPYFTVTAAQKWTNLTTATSLVVRCPVNETGGSEFALKGIQPVGRHVFIYHGNLTIDGDFTCCVKSGYTYDNCTDPGELCKNTYLINGNLTINTNVNNVRGIFVVGGTFKDYTDNANKTGSKLTVNGAVYAEQMDLKRQIANSPATPTLEVIFSPENYFLYDRVCGEETDFANHLTCYHLNGKSLGWKETAP